MKQLKISNQIFIDPVCFMKIAIGENILAFTYKMRTYYFCAESSLKSFEANPDKYLESTSSKTKGWWSRYLDRLNRATGGKPPKCH